jgi:hypothetical protein
MSFSTHSQILFPSEYFHYKIFIHKKCLENKNDNFQDNISRPGIIDARARYRAAARRLRNTALYSVFSVTLNILFVILKKSQVVFCSAVYTVLYFT